MAYGPNRAAARPRASFQVAGGTIMKFRHPFLSGQISSASPVDEIDISRCVKLNETFFDAQPTQDSALQEVLVDGSVVSITNSLLNGELTLQVIRTTGLVGTGDFIAAAHLIIASKDDVGGTFTVIENINGKRIVTVFYGVSFKRVPHLRKAGNAVIPYPVVLLYSGWVQGVSGDSTINEKTIWAVGNKFGLKGVYKPYGIQEAEGGSYFSGSPLSSSTTGVDTNDGDSATADLASNASNPSPVADGMSSTPTPSTTTWPAEPATPSGAGGT
jgi:hypothetical protein